jgi:hypothetical protein
MTETNRAEILQLDKIDDDYVDVFQEIYDDESLLKSKSGFFDSLITQIENRKDLTETETTQLTKVIHLIDRNGTFDETTLIDHNFCWSGTINSVTYHINSYKAKEIIVFKVNVVINVLMAFQNEIARLKKLMSGDKLINMYQKNETKLKDDNDKLRKIIRSLSENI